MNQNITTIHWGWKFNAGTCSVRVVYQCGNVSLVLRSTHQLVRSSFQRDSYPFPLQGFFLHNFVTCLHFLVYFIRGLYVAGVIGCR